MPYSFVKLNEILEVGVILNIHSRGIMRATTGLPVFSA